jgi:hypothetical protein
VIYQKASQVEEKQRNMLLMLPRCFGLMSSEAMLAETGIATIRRQPRLDLLGQGVMLGIVDTGAGVRKVNKVDLAKNKGLKKEKN